MSPRETTAAGATAPDPLDRRLAAARPDLADARLAGRVEAERFVEGAPHRVRAASAPLRREPSPDAPLDTELLAGEPVDVFETDGEGWAWLQSEADGYVGYAPADALVARAAAPEPTHRVVVPATLLFPEPDIKTPPVGTLSMGAWVAVVGEMAGRDGRTFLRLADQRLVVERHVRGLDAAAMPDWVALAASLSGTPYLWGGKTRAGIDCSGLVQLAMQTAGLEAPRDTDMQEAAIGDAIAVDPERPAGLARGDLLFWPGHVGVMVDEARLLHANAHHMLTALEPLDTVLARHAEAGLSLRTVRRP